MDGRNNQWKQVALAGLVAACGNAAAAEQWREVGAPPERELYLGIGGGRAWLDDQRGDPDHGSGLQLLLGWKFAGHWNLEVGTSHFNFETGDVGDTDFYRNALTVDLLWTTAGAGWRPYLLAGIGAAYNDVFPDSGDGLDPVANVGVGVMSRPFGSYGLRLRAEGRYVRDWTAGSHADDRHVYLGLIIPLHKPPAPQVEVREVVREVVRQVPAPAAPPPPDSDRDGVPDPGDRCPNTLPGTRVDSEGCAIQSSVVTLQGVHFETGSARLTAGSSAILSQAAAALSGQPSMRIEVRGHTDSVGSEQSNQVLSARRAQSVVDFLAQNGIDAARLQSTGFGEGDPVADNATAEGRASNRRVEFRVLAR